ncbi:MAG: universal stress protein [Bryobacterales bacterium]|nr:universal stress protein [Bryobacteraceae bacterium]MDW8353202.1 universal stress protein [Bryobacterales bacterium]
MPAAPLEHILCPVDFSEISALGLRFGAALGRCSGARLTVLFADPFLPPPYFTESRLEELRRQRQEWFEQARRSLDKFVTETLPDGAEAVETQVIEALPVDGILRAVRELPADLIAMGTHGRSGVNRLMLGSVAERVLRASPVPVLTVRPTEHGPEPFDRPRHIVCPVNDTAVARRSLAYAAQMAHCFQAELTVLHVSEPGARDRIGDLCAWVPAELRSLCSLREVTRQGEAAREIIAAASESRCDLLVMGARHRRFFDTTVLGTTTVRVVRHSPCAVLTVIDKESKES